MNPSSRTPEGMPFRCPLCGNDARIELSSYPIRDATCPHCGQLVQPPTWKSHSLLNQPLTYTPTYSQPIDIAYDFVTEHDFHQKAFSVFDRRSWTVVSVLSFLTVFANDGLLHSGIWWLAIRSIATLIVPRLHQWAHSRLEHSSGLYLGVVIGWALGPGLPVGILFGTILPSIYDCGLSSLAGGFMGLVLGPCFAIIQGLCIIGMIDGVFWLFTGRRIGNAT